MQDRTLAPTFVDNTEAKLITASQINTYVKCLIVISGVKTSQARVYTNNLNSSPADRDTICLQEARIVGCIW